MYKYIRLPLITILFLGLISCKKEKTVFVLQSEYESSLQEVELSADDFVVNLHARALQKSEQGEWSIKQGEVIDGYVLFEDKNNPFTRFKGLPGKEYTLEWKRRNKNGHISAVETKVKIPELNIEISDNTPKVFKTIIALSVNPKYKGEWSFTPAYGRIESKYFDGYAEEPKYKPSIELHGYANTTYTAVYTYTYAGREYKFQKTIKTGDYTQDEGLYELQISRGDHRIIEDKSSNVLELNLQSEGIAWILGDLEHYPALQSFKKLRNLNLQGSSLDQVPALLGDYYTDLEELNMYDMGYNIAFPENFGNLTKLKTLIASPLYIRPLQEVVLPSSFSRLESLEYFKTRDIGYINFNGTLGGLKNLKYLEAYVKEIPQNIGDLKNLQHINLRCRSSVVPERFSECAGLTFIRMAFDDFPNGKVLLPSRIGDLKKLETFQITTNMLSELPASFTGLSALKVLAIESSGLKSIPEDFGSLVNLNILTLYGGSIFSKLPDSFGSLSNLTHLYLGGQIEQLPESFGNLSSLYYFNAEFSSLKKLPDSFGRLKKLEELNLGRAKIEYLPDSFAELDALKKLNLAYTQLKTFPKAVIPLKSISNITLNGCMVGDIPDEIAEMRTGVLFYLYLVPNLTLEHIKHIKNISQGNTFITSYGYF